MKMKSKLNAMLAAVTFAFAGAAVAEINTGNLSTAGAQQGNGELFLSVWNTSLSVSYTRDLGINLSNFLSTGTSAPVDSGAIDFAWNPTAAPGIAAGNVLTPGYQLVWGADPTGPNATLQTLLSTSGTIWSVIAGDAFGVEKRLLYTSNSASVPSINDIQLGTATTNVNQHLIGVNATSTQIGALDPTANYSSVNDPATPTSYSGNSVFSTGLGTLPFSTVALVGTGLDFWSEATGAATATAFTGGKWLLAGNGTLSWDVAQVSAIPEPGTWAMLMAGLAMVGGIARRRTKV